MKKKVLRATASAKDMLLQKQKDFEKAESHRKQIELVEQKTMEQL
jgi:hypothetical protein